MIETLFTRLDSWRHLPNYQLERRADLFFSLYLKEVLEEKLGFEVSEHIIPEFPIRIGCIFPNTPIDKSYKIDYVAFSKCGKKGILIKLKTEAMSRREKQDDYLNACCRTGMPKILTGVIDIFKVTNAKRKYFTLLEYLEMTRQIAIPLKLRQIMQADNLIGSTAASNEIQIISEVDELNVIYIQPRKEKNNEISFDEFANVVKRHEDTVSQRFAKSLIDWASVVAGDKRIDLN